MKTDGEVRPTRPIRRAVEEAVERLKASGEVEVVEFLPYESRTAWELIRRLVSFANFFEGWVVGSEG